jgi:hypothetical protein
VDVDIHPQYSLRAALALRISSFVGALSAEPE